MNFVRPSVPTDPKAIAEDLRSADRRECELWGHDPVRALELGLSISIQPLTVVCGTRPVAMFGVTRTDVGTVDGHGIVWLLGSNGMASVSIDFIRQSRLWIEHVGRPLSGKVLGVGNWVDMRNRLHIRWLEWLGFSKDRVAERGGHSIGFYRRDI